MCVEVGRKLNKETYTGYKAVIKNRRKYYSPAVGTEYKVGPVKGAKKFLANTQSDWQRADILNPEADTFVKNYFGKTAVFCKKDDAESTARREVDNSGKWVIVKMTISGDLRRGNLAGDGVVVGTRIEMIEEVKTK